ncbi:MAG TPA: adenylosuccinate synthase [Thermomicrobiales bacterium]|nr:adenylosuccinate synthase [Thermomicrobiales bacterium]
MTATIIMGGQWGDEGKGKLTDALASAVSMVVRANGGSNAGHTVKNDQGTFKLHLVPSGILNPNCLCVIGAGVVVEPDTLIQELDELEQRGIDTSRLRISDRAHIVMPYHPVLDRLEEQRREDLSIGTTLRGNGPAYADKMSRHGIRIGDLLSGNVLRSRVRWEVDQKNEIISRLYRAEPLDASEILHKAESWAERLARYIRPTQVDVQDALSAGEHVLIECAQGAMLDIDYGTYPFVTSSSPTAAGACQGAGVAPRQVERVVAVYKAYSTRVGAGPMPSELKDETGERIRQRGNEFGTTTGRPRRTGWFDEVVARQSARLNGVDEVALTLLDVLDDFETIKTCTAYRRGSDVISHLPAVLNDAENAEPVWQEHVGWQTDTTGARAWDDLPPAAKSYVQHIGSVLNARVRYIGIGPAREQLIDRGPV